MEAGEEVLLERRGALGMITLNRPQALNTLSLAMYRRFDPALEAWAADPGIAAVLVQGAGPRAFCAGGDVVAIYEAHRRARAEGGEPADFFREEYRLIHRIHRFPKPYIALMDGVTMGGGVGIGVNGAYGIVTERSLLAMPEGQIGLFPDVGATRFLNRCPGRIGLYLGLTGARFGAADAIFCGFAGNFVASDRVAALIGTLTDELRPGAPEAVGAILRRFAGDPGPAPLAALQPAIDRCFAGNGVEAIAAALAAEDGAWAAAARDALQRASPLSLKIIFRQLAAGTAPAIEEALGLEYRLSQHCLAEGDFLEGVRALLVDKDRRPRWRHAAPAAVTETEVERYFRSLGERELRFP